MRLPKILAATAGLALAFNAPVAQAAACQPGTTGCVIPLPPGAQTAVVIPQTTAPVFIEEEGGFNFWPYLIGLAALAAAGYFLFLNDDDDVAISV